MFDLDSLKLFLVISIALSSITCAVIQKTKILFKNSKYIVYYSLIINLLTSILFCKTFVELFDGDIRLLFNQLDNNVDKIRNFIQKDNKKSFLTYLGIKYVITGYMSFGNILTKNI